MGPALRIKDYRLFRGLTVAHLAAVNLVAGWNNTGKSSLLEAVYLAGCADPLDGLRRVLEGRGERSAGVIFPGFSLTPGATVEVNLGGEYFRARVLAGEELDEVVAQRPNLHLGNGDWPVRIESSNYVGESRNLVVSRRDGVAFLSSARTGIRSPRRAMLLRGAESLADRYDELRELWDEMLLTPQAEMVVEALRIIEPRVKNLAFLSAGEGVKVLLEGEQEPVLLGSLGDGMRHLLMIAIALVGAREGVLLIDEVETGLHYTTLTGLWNLVFRMAERLNVLVLATTHSWDCIAAFGQAWEGAGEPAGLFFRLSRRGTGIAPVLYSLEDLRVAVEQRIEVR